MNSVLFINPWDKRIGPNRYLADMLAADRELAERAIVVLPEEGQAAQEYRALGCAVEIWSDATLVHLSRTRENLTKVMSTHTRGVLFARQRLTALRPSVVVTNSENVWFGGMAARSLGIPHLQVFHALTLEHHWGNRPYLVQGYLRWLKLWNKKLIGVSQTVVDMLKRNGVSPDRLALVRNGLNLDAIRAASAIPLPLSIQTQLQKRYPILVTLGRISAMKGHDLLIEAVARVKAEFPNVLCLFGGAVLSGKGVEDTATFYAGIQDRVRALGLESNITFLGEIEYAPALLKHADVYVQPSRTESFCRAVVEAMTIGVPVVAFRAGALPEVIGQAGILATPEDPSALADGIICVLKDETRRSTLRTAGQAQIQQFAIQNSTRSLRSVLNEQP